MEINYTGLIEKLVKSVNTPYYGLIDIYEDYILMGSNDDGNKALYLLQDRKKTKIANYFFNLTEITGGKFAYADEVGNGQELHKIMIYDIKKNIAVPVEMNPMRLMGMAYDGKEVAFTGISGSNTLFLTNGGKAEKLLEIKPFDMVSSLNEKYIAGSSFNQDSTSNIFFFNRSTGKMDYYTPKEGSTNGPPLLKDGKVLFSSNFEGKTKMYSMDPEERRPQMILDGETEYSSYDIVDHKTIIIGISDGRNRVYVDGKLLELPAGTINRVLPEGNGYIFSHSSMVSPLSIYRLNNGKTEKLMGAEQMDLGKVEFVRYRSFDGLEIPAFIIRSRNTPVPGPTVIYVHGGPWSEVVDSPDPFIIALSVSGFHVICPNFRGSSGYGEEFRMMDIGDPGGNDLRDIVEAVNQFRSMISEVSILGYSYGGYSTLMAMGKYPDIWKCGVAGAPVADWNVMYELADTAFKGFIDILLKSDKNLMNERSPIKYAANLKKPLCIITGQNDSRTPLKPVLQYIEKACSAGKTIEAHIVPNAGHIVKTNDDIANLVFPAVIFLKKNMS